MTILDLATQEDDESNTREITVLEAAGDCEVIESGDKWEGPFPEYDRYGYPTGEYYKRCNSCGCEVLVDVPEEAVSHRDGCKFGENQ